MSTFTLAGRLLAVVVLGCAAAVAYAGKNDKANDTGKDDKKDSKSDSKGSSGSSRDSGPARDSGSSRSAPSAPANKNEPNGSVPNRNVPNAGYVPAAPNAAGMQGFGRTLGGYSNDWQNRMQRDQLIREQQREYDESQRERDERQRDRDMDRIDRANDRLRSYQPQPSNLPNPNWIPPATDNSLRGGGNLDSIQSGQLVVKIDGEKVHVQRNGESKIDVFGTADIDALTPGRIVRIEGTFESPREKVMQATAPILAVDIITPRAGNTPGTIIPLGGVEAQNNGLNQAAAANPVRSLSVIGRVLKCVGRELTLDLDGTTLKASLDPAAIVSLRGKDINLAHAGDRVDVVGYYLKPGYAMGKEITITLAKPFGKPLNGLEKQKAAVPAANVVAPVAAKPAAAENN